MVGGALRAGEVDRRVPADVPGRLAGRVPRGWAPGEDHADPRQACGRGGGVRRKLRLGAAQVVRPARGRGALQLPPHQLVRAGRRGVPGGARARRGARSLGLREVRRDRPRCGRLPRSPLRQPGAPAPRRGGARAHAGRAGRHRVRGDDLAARRRALLRALGSDGGAPRSRLDGLAHRGRRRGGDREPYRRLRLPGADRPPIARRARRPYLGRPRQRGVPLDERARDRGGGGAGAGPARVLRGRARLGAASSHGGHGSPSTTL